MTRTPRILDFIFDFFLWRMPKDEKKIYLTFDDGPVPEITPFVLKELERFNAKATFFMVGENIDRNVSLAKEVYQQGHTLANHTYNHLNGWKTEESVYVDNVRRCQDVLNEVRGYENLLFRPPYGRIRKSQYEKVSEYQICMWSVLSKDYQMDRLAQKSLQKTIDATENGSIVLFHDSKKAAENLRAILPHFLQFAKSEGYEFGLL
ncbi:MAG: polysaccharide deacetylase family protein [Leadbetterella sp.]